jgi:hypothetical protein
VPYRRAQKLCIASTGDISWVLRLQTSSVFYLIIGMLSKGYAMAITRKTAPSPAKSAPRKSSKLAVDELIRGPKADRRSEQIIAFQTQPEADTARVPVMMRVPGDLLQRIDAAAKQRGLSRSGWFLMVATRALDRDDY